MKKWTLGSRIAAALAVLGILTAIGGLVGLISLQQISTQIRQLATADVPAVLAADEICTLTAENRAYAYRHLGANSDAEMARFEKAVQDNLAVVQKDVDTLVEALHEPIYQEALEKAGALRKQVGAIRTKVFEISRNKQNEAAYTLASEQMAPVTDQYLKAVNGFADILETRITQNANRAESLARWSSWLTLIAISGGTLVGSTLGFLLIRSTNKTLRSISGSIQNGSVQLTSAAEQVSKSSQSLAQGATEQAASLEETSASLEEISSLSKNSLEGAQKAKNLLDETQAAANAGATDMREMSQAMAEINAASDSIAKIIKTIDEIAFQTNILALNAAVEAARAGEAGAGFAVVADEVRTLAQRAAQSAKETADKIADSVSKSQRGVQINAKLSKSLEEIVTKVHEVGKIAAESAQSAQEQSQGLGQINTAVSQMDQVTQSNAASAEESASAAEELNAQALALSETVGELAALVGGTVAQQTTSYVPEPEPEPKPKKVAEKQPAKATLPVSKPKNIVHGKGKAPDDFFN